MHIWYLIISTVSHHLECFKSSAYQLAICVQAQRLTSPSLVAPACWTRLPSRRVQAISQLTVLHLHWALVLCLPQSVHHTRTPPNSLTRLVTSLPCKEYAFIEISNYNMRISWAWMGVKKLCCMSEALSNFWGLLPRQQTILRIFFALCYLQANTVMKWFGSLDPWPRQLSVQHCLIRLDDLFSVYSLYVVIGIIVIMILLFQVYDAKHTPYCLKHFTLSTFSPPAVFKDRQLKHAKQTVKQYYRFCWSVAQLHKVNI